MNQLELVDRHGTDSNKWRRYAPDVIPLWVADMDYAAAPSILHAVRARLDQGCLGYGRATDEMRETLVGAIARDHGWQIEPDWLVFLPGVEPGFNMALSAFTQPGQAAMQEGPVYKPLRAAPGHWTLTSIEVPQTAGPDGRWHTDRDALSDAAGRSSAWLLCNPQNPTGRVYSADELEFRADLCIRHDLTLISDEIHCGLTLAGRRHIPIASLDPAIAERTVTLMSASKTWNIAGLKTAFAIVSDQERRLAFEARKLGMVDSVNVLGLAAMTAAYQATGWRDAIRLRMEANLRLLADRLARDIPGARLHTVEASFLAWIDFTALKLEVPAAEFFHDAARVALSDGTEFGPDLSGWARLNYGCSPELLEEALDRMVTAVNQQPSRTEGP